MEVKHGAEKQGLFDFFFLNTTTDVEQTEQTNKGYAKDDEGWPGLWVCPKSF